EGQGHVHLSRPCDDDARPERVHAAVTRHARGGFAAAVVVIQLVATRGFADDESADVWAALAKGGHVALIRHANAPPGYGGDPPGFRLDDCTTQRNLDEGLRNARRTAPALLQNETRL